MRMETNNFFLPFAGTYKIQTKFQAKEHRGKLRFTFLFYKLNHFWMLSSAKHKVVPLAITSTFHRGRDAVNILWAVTESLTVCCASPSSFADCLLPCQPSTGHSSVNRTDCLCLNVCLVRKMYLVSLHSISFLRHKVSTMGFKKGGLCQTRHCLETKTCTLLVTCLSKIISTQQSETNTSAYCLESP